MNNTRQNISNLEIPKKFDFISDHGIVRITLGTNIKAERKSYKILPKRPTYQEQTINYKIALSNNLKNLEKLHAK